jgi:quercetin dioxygenase-like cupin family protein
LIFALFEHPDGVETEPGPRVVYDLERGTARLGAARVEGPALVWEMGAETDLVTDRYKGSRTLAVEVAMAVGEREKEVWLVRWERVQYPPGGVAYRHDHPGPGIRRLLFGELTIESEDGTHTHGPGDAWFEDTGFPVVATASESEPTAFVRVLLLPPEWAGRRTIRYLTAADEERPKLQRATVLLEETLRL